MFPFLRADSTSAVGFSEILHAALDPAYVVEKLNRYVDDFVPLMNDNSIHWFNLLAQSGFFWNNAQVFSLSAFTHSLLGDNVPGIVFKIPVFLVVAFSAGLMFIKNQRCRLETSLLIYLASIFSFFLSYNIVYEYQYTSVLPAVAILLLLWSRNPEHKPLFGAILLCSVFFLLPSPYFLVRDLPLNHASMNITRATRVLPTLIIFVLLAAIVCNKMIRSYSLERSTATK